MNKGYAEQNQEGRAWFGPRIVRMAAAGCVIPEIRMSSRTPWVMRRTDEEARRGGYITVAIRMTVLAMTPKVFVKRVNVDSISAIGSRFDEV